MSSFPRGGCNPTLEFGPEFALGKVKAEFEENGFKTKIEENEGAFGVDVQNRTVVETGPNSGGFLPNIDLPI